MLRLATRLARPRLMHTGARRRRVQAQNLTKTEADQFSVLLDDLAMLSQHGDERAVELQPVAEAVRRQGEHAEQRRSERRRKLGELPGLGAGDEERLDKLRKELEQCDTPPKALAWAQTALYDGAAPRDRKLYKHLLADVFQHVRERLGAPQVALHIFSQAAAQPDTFLLGCTTTLYNQVLRMHWVDFAGDTPGMLKRLCEMRDAGVPIDTETREIVADVSSFVHMTWRRAEAHGESALLDKTQLDAWSRLESIVEDDVQTRQEDKEDKRRARQRRAR